jgi:D-glycero-alpha-D-manno-heptose-7-phosphate kinase
MLHSLHALKGQMVSKEQLALEAIFVEQELIRENVGSQDQVTAAYGGFNRIDFGQDRSINVSPICLGAKELRLFQEHLMLFFTGFARTASEVAGEQIKNTANKERELLRMKDLVDEAIVTLCNGFDMDRFGKLLHETWLLKRGLTNKISTSFIDEIYDVALRAGAIGGKLLGAGGGGCILFFVMPELQGKIKEALKRLLYIPFNFEDSGSRIVYYVPSDSAA